MPALPTHQSPARQQGSPAGERSTAGRTIARTHSSGISLLQRIVEHEAVRRGPALHSAPGIMVQRAPEEPAAIPTAPPTAPAPVDPLLDYETMEIVAAKGASQLEAYRQSATSLWMSCSNDAYRGIEMTYAVANATAPVFSPEYEKALGEIRNQAVQALTEARGFLLALDKDQIRSWGATTLQGVDVALATINDGNDIVFIVDSRTEAGKDALMGIEHFDEQMATREAGFVDETGKNQVISSGASVHPDRVHPDELSSPTSHRSVSILDLGALYDNRAMVNFVGPIQDPPGTLEVHATPAFIDVRAVFLHEVGGHALDAQTPAEKERIAAGQKLTEGMNKSHKPMEEMLVNLMVDKTAFYSFVRADLPPEMLRRIAR